MQKVILLLSMFGLGTDMMDLIASPPNYSRTCAVHWGSSTAMTHAGNTVQT